MDISDQLLSSLVTYGLPVLFGVVFVAAAGLPLPATLLLIAAGAFTDSGQLSFVWVVVLATLAAVAGDNLAYGASRWGGRKLTTRLERWAGGPERLRQAERTVARWGGTGVFLSRWLLTPVGPALNVASGLTNYTWGRFALFGFAGEVVWVLLYTMIGRVFSDRVQQIGDVAGDLTWVACGIALVGLLSWGLWRRWRAVQEPDRSRAAA